MARLQSFSEIGRWPMEISARTRRLASWPPEVATVTPWTEAPATVSARSTAWAMASTASSVLTMAPAAHAAGLDVAHAGGLQGAVGPAHAVGLHDETGDLGRAEVDSGW